MIVKELDAFVPGDTLAQAGRKAEEDLAHYLRRAFKESPDFFVFNNIRLEQDGDAAQIDHLILYRYGVILVESKSVSSRIRVNEHEEWARFWNGSWRGIPSPIKQAERQGEFLRQILQQNRTTLRNKVLLGLRQGGFLTMNIDVLVAVSDSGIIERPRRGNGPDEVCKSDQVAERITQIQAGYRRKDNIFQEDPVYILARNEIEKIIPFLRDLHRPLVPTSASLTSAPARVKEAAPAAPYIAAEPAPPTATLCRHCHSHTMNIAYGQYGYYFKCCACQGNTPIKRACPSCGGKERIRKSGAHFFAECDKCSTSYVFHTNTGDGELVAK